MKISYNWLREFVATGLAPSEVTARLTMVGLAVDSVEQIGDDYVFDVEVASNRPDCLSHIGVARELAVILRTNLQLPFVNKSRVVGSSSDLISVRIDDVDLCPRYSARVVRNVKVGPSPDWLVARLASIGQRSINNIADITNYVMHEVGKPIHAFDLSQITDAQIIVRRARSDESIITLDGVVRRLDREMLVIADSMRAVAIGGVMGAENSEISVDTKDVLIESALFQTESIWRTAGRLGLQSEAAYRFSRGVDPEVCLAVIDRAFDLMCEIAGGTADNDAVDVYPNRKSPAQVSLRQERIEQITALRVDEAESERILLDLGFLPRENSAINQRVRDYLVPSWRFDVHREEDLVEEIARHVGYEKIATHLPASTTIGAYQKHEGRRRAIRQSLNGAGFSEAINLSFSDSSHDNLFDLLPGLKTEGQHQFLTLVNPIAEGFDRMRPTLLSGLLNAVRTNLNHGIRDVRLFEIGRIFVKDQGELQESKLPQERESLGLIATRPHVKAGSTSGSGDKGELNFYDVKGALEAIAEAINIAPFEFTPATVRHLRSGQSAIVLLEGRPIGSLGRLSHEIADAFRFKQPTFIAELDLSLIEEASQTPVRYQPLARFPSVLRDASLLIDRQIKLSDVMAFVRTLNADYLAEVSFVGVYEGSGVADDKRSLTLKFEYRSPDRTLHDEEADEAHSKIMNMLQNSFGAILR